MSDRNILDADVSELGQWLVQGLDWWRRELIGLVPQRWRAGGVQGLLAVISSDRRVSYVRDGHAVSAPRQPSKAWVSVQAPGHLVLTRTIDLPVMSQADTRRVIGYDLDRYMPLKAEAVYLAVGPGTRLEAPGRQQVTLAVLPRLQAESVLGSARAVGLDPHSLTWISPQGQAFVFATDSRLETQTRRSHLTWIAVVALLALNAGLLVYRDVQDIEGLRRLSEDQAPMAALAVKLRGRVEAEEVRRAAWSNRQATQDPLAILNALTQALPNSVWVQRLEWNGKLMRITGYKEAAFNMTAALNGSPLLTRARQLDIDNRPLPPNVRQPFDATAAMEPAGGSR